MGNRRNFLASVGGGLVGLCGWETARHEDQSPQHYIVVNDWEDDPLVFATEELARQAWEVIIAIFANALGEATLYISGVEVSRVQSGSSGIREPNAFAFPSIISWTNSDGTTFVIKRLPSSDNVVDVLYTVSNDVAFYMREEYPTTWFTERYGSLETHEQRRNFYNFLRGQGDHLEATYHKRLTERSP